MGDYESKERQSTKSRSTATAGPSAADRHGHEWSVKNVQSRIIKHDIVGDRTLVTIARGKHHGIHEHMEGYVKGPGGSMLAMVRIQDVRSETCTAWLDTTVDQLAGHLYVVINPSRYPQRPKQEDPSRTRVIGVSVEGGRTRIVIARGVADGVVVGTRGVLLSEGGTEGDEFTVVDVHTRQAIAYVASPVDHVNQHKSVRLDVASNARAPVQRRATGAASSTDVNATAAAGVAGASGHLPFFDTIQRSFGKHDISNIQSQVGGAAAAASETLGARAYATGDKVAFASAPDLHTAAHEAAHTIQQRHGAVGFQGLGAADDDHERHADAVADAVVAGESAEALLDQVSGGNTARTVVQRRSTSGPEPRRGDHAPPTTQGAFAAPPRIELVADGVGRLAKTRAQIAVRAPKGSGPSIVTSATPELFRVISAPNILPTIEEHASHNEFVIGFGAPQAGTHHGTLAVRAQTPGFRDLHIPLTGYTDPTLVPARTPSERRLRIPASVDLGEHVVGSEQIYDIARVGLPEPGTATIHPFTIIDQDSMQSRQGDDGPLVLQTNRAAGFRRVASEAMRISDTAQQTLHIFFAPDRAGLHKALLEIPITWEDGVATKQYVWISGRARPITQAPDDKGFGTMPASSEKPSYVHLEVNGDPKHDFGLISDTAESKAHSIALAQMQGLKQAFEASRGYVAKPPPPSILASLVETALSMANAGLARFFATKIAQGIVGDLAKAAVADASVKDQARAQLAIISEPIREGLKNAGKGQIASIKQGFATKGVSPHRLQGFWDLQDEALLKQTDSNRQLIINAKYRLEPLLAKSPDVAVLTQETMLRALEATAAQAKHQQLMASLSQYLVAVASSNPGRSANPLEDRLHIAREQGVGYSFNYKRGILQLTAELQGNSLAVRSAKITGVSRLVVEKFQPFALATLPIPIMVAVKSKAGAAVITRDDRGVIRVSGDVYVRTSPMDPEANKVELATELLETLLSKPLDVPIGHDDVSDHTEQAG